MKNFSKCQETMIMQHETCWIVYTIKNYKPIVIDLSRQTNRNTPQQINFEGKLEEDNIETMLSIAEKQQKI